MPPWLISLGLGGIAAAYLYRKYGSIIPPWFNTSTQSATFEPNAPSAYQQIMFNVFQMLPSQYALDFIRQFEKFSATVYDAHPPNGDWTIGYGHKIGPNDPLYNSVIDASQAEQLLQQDVQLAVNCIQQAVTVPLSQSQFDALVSFVFNVGCYAFVHGGSNAAPTAFSHILTYLNNGDYANAAQEFTKWIYAGGQIVGGLVDRRVAEQSTFMSGIAAG